jgi:amidohydrolase
MPAPAALLGDDLRMRLEDAYRDLHAHPELSFGEHHTADLAATCLTRYGYEVTQDIGGTGLTGVSRNGDGPLVLLRADMDGLPVLENTGLPYASVARGRDDEGNDVPVMHACGHDVHVTCLLGASAVMAEDRSSWQGTLVVLFQPVEELGKGASSRPPLGSAAGRRPPPGSAGSPGAAGRCPPGSGRVAPPP